MQTGNNYKTLETGWYNRTSEEHSPNQRVPCYSQQNPMQHSNAQSLLQNQQRHFSADSLEQNAGRHEPPYPNRARYANSETNGGGRHPTCYPQMESGSQNNCENSTGAWGIPPYPQVARYSPLENTNPYHPSHTVQCPPKPKESRWVAPYPQVDIQYPYNFVNPINGVGMTPCPQTVKAQEHHPSYPPWHPMNPSTWGICPWVMG